jgi:hypothetical protein
MRFEVVYSNQTKKCLERIGKLYNETDKVIVNTPVCSLYLSTGKLILFNFSNISHDLI